MMDYVAFDKDNGVAAEVYQTGARDWRIVLKDTDADLAVSVLNIKDTDFRVVKERADFLVGFQN